MVGAFMDTWQWKVHPLVLYPPQEQMLLLCWSGEAILLLPHQTNCIFIEKMQHSGVFPISLELLEAKGPFAQEKMFR